MIERHVTRPEWSFESAATWGCVVALLLSLLLGCEPSREYGPGDNPLNGRGNKPAGASPSAASRRVFANSEVETLVSSGVEMGTTPPAVGLDAGTLGLAPLPREGSRSVPDGHAPGRERVAPPYRGSAPGLRWQTGHERSSQSASLLSALDSIQRRLDAQLERLGFVADAFALCSDPAYGCVLGVERFYFEGAMPACQCVRPRVGVHPLRRPK